MLYLDASLIVRHAALLLVFGWCKTTSVSAQFREPPAAPVATKPAETKPVEIADEPRTIDPATLVPALLATPKTIAFKETALKEVVAWLQHAANQRTGSAIPLLIGAAAAGAITAAGGMLGMATANALLALVVAAEVMAFQIFHPAEEPG